MKHLLSIVLLALIFSAAFCFAEPDIEDDEEETLQPTAQNTLKDEKIASKTDDDVIEREEISTSPDGLSETERRKAEETAEKFEFQAEVNKIMKIIVHSLYSNKEIFLRELISNASDALDKIRFQSLTNPSALDNKREFEIKIKADKENRTLTISDTGIGMTKEDLIKNLGTIAQSGTASFAQALEKGVATNLIGQFGVGFYSAYLVADKITVVTKHNDDPQQWIWESHSQSSFSISPDPRGNTLGRGTSITLALKSDPEMIHEMDEYLDVAKLKELVQKYSQFIDFPIYLWTSHEEEKEVPVEEEEEEEEEEEQDEELDELDVEESEKEEEKPKTKTVKETVWDWEQINVTKPIWLRKKDDVTDEEYNSFYKALTKDVNDPATYIHFSAEGDVDFKAILYLPKEPPYGQFDPTLRQKGVKLYVRRVFITDDFDTVIPKYLGFLKGVVDSDSIPLNISREMLQEHKALDIIKKKLVRKAIAMFQLLAQEGEDGKYDEFWENYGVNIKLGVIDDLQNRTRLSKLLRFKSSKSEGEWTGFDEYITRMKEGQDEIYFLSGSNEDEIRKSPLLEKLLQKDYEVLFTTEPIDEYVMQNLAKYESKYKLVNVAKDELKLTDDDKDKDDDDEEEDKEKEFKELNDYFKENFSSLISKVKVSNRLTKSPCALVAEAWGYTATMERVMMNQALADKRANDPKLFIGKKVLEINPNHPLIKSLNTLIKEEGKDSQKAKGVASLLLDTAALSSGYSVGDTHKFVNNINNILMSSLGLEPIPEPEENNNTQEETEDNGDDHNHDHDEL